jgi:hypothetical protein
MVPTPFRQTITRSPPFATGQGIEAFISSADRLHLFLSSSLAEHTFNSAGKSEEATRQQGDLFFRENSSNGGKAIRTFWRNTKFAKIRCQGLNFIAITRYLGISYGGYFSYNRAYHIRYLFAFNQPENLQTTLISAV